MKKSVIVIFLFFISLNLLSQNEKLYFGAYIGNLYNINQYADSEAYNTYILGYKINENRYIEITKSNSGNFVYITELSDKLYQKTNHLYLNYKMDGIIKDEKFSTYCIFGIGLIDSNSPKYLRTFAPNNKNNYSNQTGSIAFGLGATYKFTNYIGFDIRTNIYYDKISKGSNSIIFGLKYSF